MVKSVKEVKKPVKKIEVKVKQEKEIKKEPEFSIKEIVEIYLGDIKSKMVNGLVMEVLSGKPIYQIMKESGRTYQDISDIFVAKMRDIYRNVTPDVDTDGKLSISQIKKELEK